jgi:hypothetical protein
MVRTEKAALEFLDRVGFCFLFPQKGLVLASLWQAVKGDSDVMHSWDADAERVWGWKDDFPRRGKAWYGKLLRRKPSFLGTRMLPSFMAAAQARDHSEAYADGRLSTEARDIADWVDEHGPTAVADLRTRFGGKTRADKGLEQLQGLLLLTHYGTSEQKAGWPSAVVEQTARAFPSAWAEADEIDPAEARQTILEAYRRQQPSATDKDAARVLGFKRS